MKKLNTRILSSTIVIALMSMALGLGATAYFSDTETSTGNTFTAGTLDLQVNGDDSNIVAFTVSNMRPGNQPKTTYTLNNIGSLSGYLDLENIVVTDNENGITDPEDDAGDVTPSVGELSSVVNLRLFIDLDGNGWIGTGDIVFFNDYVANLPSNFELDEPIAAGGTIYITALFDWWNTPNDNLAQGDSMVIDIEFELGQNTGI